MDTLRKVNITQEEMLAMISLSVVALVFLKVFNEDLMKHAEKAPLGSELLASIDKEIKRSGMQGIIAMIEQGMDERERELTMDMLETTLGKEALDGIL